MKLRAAARSSGMPRREMTAVGYRHRVLEELRQEAEAAGARGPHAHASALVNLGFALSQRHDESATEVLDRAFSIASAVPGLEAQMRLRLAEVLAGAGALELAARVLKDCPLPTDPVDVLRLEDARDEVSLRLAGGSVNPAALLTRRLFGKPPSASMPSKERVLMASSGEIKTADTVDKKGRPARGGPRCERIFGPITHFACACGRYSGREVRGVVCERCAVEVIGSDVRAQRHGHVVLAESMIHPWFSERVDVLAVPPPDAPVPGGHTTHDALELVLRELLDANKKARSIFSNEANRAALQRAVTAWFELF